MLATAIKTEVLCNRAMDEDGPRSHTGRERGDGEKREVLPEKEPGEQRKAKAVET